MRAFTAFAVNQISVAGGAFGDDPKAIRHLSNAFCDRQTLQEAGQARRAVEHVG